MFNHSIKLLANKSGRDCSLTSMEGTAPGGYPGKLLSVRWSQKIASQTQKTKKWKNEKKLWGSFLPSFLLVWTDQGKLNETEKMCSCRRTQSLKSTSDDIEVN